MKEETQTTADTVNPLCFSLLSYPPANPNPLIAATLCLCICVSALYVTARFGLCKGVTVTRCSPSACEQALTWGFLFPPCPLQVFGLEREGLSDGEEQGGP